ncbi:MAG: CoA-binding protein [Candidatus Nomurabacteria bacterium]|nr:MAG: CoA-binding protein [Candidatus Nomurabacteria bacterium]
MDLSRFLQKNFRYAVIGSVYNPEKYGHKVLLDLQSAGLRVFGIHPQAGEVEGISIYSSLREIPGKIDVVVFVIKADDGLRVLDEIEELGIDKVWFQPGAEDERIRQKITQLHLDGVADGSCIMVARRTLGIHG